MRPILRNQNPSLLSYPCCSCNLTKDLNAVSSSTYAALPLWFEFLHSSPSLQINNQQSSIHLVSPISHLPSPISHLPSPISSNPIQRTYHPRPIRSRRPVQINLRRGDVLVSQQILDLPQAPSWSVCILPTSLILTPMIQAFLPVIHSGHPPAAHSHKSSSGLPISPRIARASCK